MEEEVVDKVRMSQDSGMSSVGSVSPADELGPDTLSDPSMNTPTEQSIDNTSTGSSEHVTMENGECKFNSNEGGPVDSKSTDDNATLTRNASVASDTDSAVSSSSKLDSDSCSITITELPPVNEECKVAESASSEAISKAETVTPSDSGESLSDKLDSDVDMPDFMIFYLGSLQLDRRHTSMMLPWIMAEVRRRHEITPIKLVIHAELLHAMSVDGEETMIFEHKLQGLSRFARSHQENTIFAYSTRAGADAPFTCHVFQAQETKQVAHLFRSIKEATKQVMKKDHFGNEGKSVDECDELVKIGHESFEVLYVGRVQVNHKKASPNFIDDMVDKFRSEKLDMVRNRHASGSSIQSLPCNLETVNIKENDIADSRASSTSGEISTSETGSGESLHVHFQDSQNKNDDQRPLLDKNLDIPKVKIRHASASSASQAVVSESDQGKPKIRHRSGTDKPVKDSENLMRDALTGSIGCQADAGRIMLFKIGGEEVCLISLDQKTVILDRNFKDISFCAQGVRHPDHFGFICRNHQNNTFVCYMFKCASDAVVDEVLRGLQQAFNAAHQRAAKNHHVCEYCPMHQLHKLCVELEGLPASKIDEIITKRVEQLSEKDREEVQSRVKSEAPMSVEDSNEVSMKALRMLCEARQLEHKHISDNHKQPRKGEFCLIEPVPGCKGSPMSHGTSTHSTLDRVRRSLTSSFEFLKGRRSSQDELEFGRDRERSKSEISFPNILHLTDTSSNNTPDISPCPSPIKKEFGEKLAFKKREDFALRPRSHTVDSGEADKTPACTKYTGYERTNRKISAPARPHGGEFAHSPKPSPNKSSRAGAGDHVSPAHSPRRPAPPPTLEETTPRRKMGSWRQAIFISVVTPSGKSRRRSSALPDESSTSSEGAGTPRSPVAPLTPTPRLSRDELRALWRKAILETLLLIRMEKENKNLQGTYEARQDEMETKRIKLDYEEITPCLIKVTKVWEEMIKTPMRRSVKFSVTELQDSVKAGVPRAKRGEIWQVLLEQHCHSHTPVFSVSHELDANYQDLLRQLTTHQHAILIDLGRTFPAHPYFSTQLGAGQLALFNLLKSYSLLDSEVGYCQGLSFVAGVLLMHMQEESAFHALKYIMFNMGLRAQYRPDMTALQIQLYQLSRLLHDHYKDLYDHFEIHEINPTLYAAPWFLTLFASQFPLGFVARVFDLLLLQGLEVIFKVAITLLGYHKELILQCDSFETIVEFLKTTLPAMGIIQMERVINQVFVMDITQKLHAYEVEYMVLQEEMVNSPRSSDTDTILRLEATNASLRQYNSELVDQLNAALSTQRSLESNIQSLHNNENKLKSHIQTLELERAALLNTVQKMKELIPDDAISNANINIPQVMPATTNVGSPLHTNAHAANRERKKPANLTLTPESSPIKRPSTMH